MSNQQEDQQPEQHYQPTQNRLPPQHQLPPLHHHHPQQPIFLHRKHRSYSGTSTTTSSLSVMVEPKSELGKKGPSGEDLCELYQSSLTSSKLSSTLRPTSSRLEFDSSSSATFLSTGLTTDALPPAPPPPPLNMTDGSNSHPQDPIFSSFHKFRIGLGGNGAGRRRGSNSSIGRGVGGGVGGGGAVGRVGERALSPKRSRSLSTAADVALLLEVHSLANQGRFGGSSISSAPASDHTSLTVPRRNSASTLLSTSFANLILPPQQKSLSPTPPPPPSLTNSSSYFPLAPPFPLGSNPTPTATTTFPYSSHPGMMGSGADPGPGPTPPPSLTLPPLRELDKGIRPDSSSSHRGSTGLGLMGGPGGQPRSQFTDPHLHQHSHSQQSMQQQHYQQQQQQQQQQHQQRGPISHSFPQYPSSSSSSSSHGAGSQQYYPHDHHSRHSSSVGSLPDLYMSSSGAPSTVSRADSLSSIEYLHGSHPLHSHAHRHLSGSVSGSTTTGSTTGSSFGHSIASGSVSSGGSSSVYLHHSTGLGRANLNAAILHQRNPRDSAASPTAGSGDASSSAAANNGTHATNGKSGSTAGGSAGTEQGRNSTKRAAQNRAAQRAFRQRKDLYVRELERKAELLQQAEGKILRLTARNRELEVALAANNPSSSSSLSPQQSPLHSHASPTTGLVCAAGSSSEQDQQHQQQQQQQQPNHTLHHSSSRDQLDRGDRERGASGGEWDRGEKSSLPGRDQEFYDDNSSTHSGHNYPSSLGRTTLGRRSASQPMRSAYNASSPPLTNDSLKFHSLKQQLAANQHLNQPHSLPRLPQQQQHPSRTDSDYEFEGLDHPVPHRQLHRHPSEPSLNQSRRGSNSADSGDDYMTSGVQNHRQNTYPHDQSRSHGPRRSSVDSRMELTSPVFKNNQSASFTYRSSNNGANAGSHLLPSEYPESASPPSLTQPYTSNGNVQHERQPLYPITTQGGTRSAPLGSARSWGGAQQEDGIKPHSPMMASPVAGLSRGSVGGGMATSAASPTRGSGGYSRGNDMEYLSDERSETGSGFDAMNKRLSDGAISWSGSNSSGGRGGGPPGPEPQLSSSLAYHNNASSRGNGLGLRKENSWSSFSAVSKGSNDGYNREGGLSPVSLPPVSALAGAGPRKMGDDMEMQDSHHDPRSTQHLQQHQQQRDGERHPSGSDVGANYHRGSIAMMSDSPEMGSSDTRFLNNNNNNNNNTSTSSVTTPQISCHHQQYFSSQQQQQHRASPFAPQQHHQHHHLNHHGGSGAGHHPLSPANEYPPGPGGAAAAGASEMDGVFEQQQQQHHQSRYNNYSGGIAAGYHEETMMRSP